MKERKCFGCREFGHITHHCKVEREEGPAQVSLNRFEVLRDRVMQREEGSRKEVVKDRREILREEKAKREVEVQQIKMLYKKVQSAIESQKKEMLLREAVMKIGLK